MHGDCYVHGDGYGWFVVGKNYPNNKKIRKGIGREGEGRGGKGSEGKIIPTTKKLGLGLWFGFTTTQYYFGKGMEGKWKG